MSTDLVRAAAWAAPLLRRVRRIGARASLPEHYRILPEEIRFAVPGFPNAPQVMTLSPAPIDCTRWYHGFVDRLATDGGGYFPVMRMSDGEFLFALGEQPPSARLPGIDRIRLRFRHARRARGRRGAFGAATAIGVASGWYPPEQWRQGRSLYGPLTRRIASSGCLALHLSYGPRPFQEGYFPALGRWLDEEGIALTLENYVPFYFVYAALTGPLRSEILAGRSVVLVNAAEGEKRKRIEQGLLREGVTGVQWLSISPDQSLFDRLDLSRVSGPVDLALVGAGVGKPNILGQLEPLAVPCIDVGYLFEVWANPAMARQRSYCLPLTATDPGSRAP